MIINAPLTPHLEEFVNHQLASGQFRTEGDLICAALRLLEDQAQGASSATRLRDAGTGLTSGSLESHQAASWNELRERLNYQGPGSDRLSISRTRRSPRGILADLRSHVSLDDFKEARREAWLGLPRGPA